MAIAAMPARSSASDPNDVPLEKKVTVPVGAARRPTELLTVATKTRFEVLTKLTAFAGVVESPVVVLRAPVPVPTWTSTEGEEDPR
jgi:hypothetical protein